ncbi:hypothetical protein A4G99_15275 [Haladaptatus sp. R4]|uniref:amidohydrolase family protein n=1 Tax=Haladaptatus sp. R4 TaxID=1679489 RepID=UPI0007B499F2|nr:amidohydrolase family protein [Haladaptatus sp. R4]KZN23372.1 hypothetical protein A4G99_15275 [Haladaptatus sp. R4]
MDLREQIEGIALVDNHAHPVEPLSAETVRESFAGYFTEGDLSPRHARQTLNYRAALDLLDERFEGKTEDELLSRRAAVDLESYSRDLIDGTNTEKILVDDGFPDTSPDDFRTYTTAAVHPLLRIEPVLEELLDRHDSFAGVERAFEDAIDDALADDYVGLKTIVAYRSGLAVGNPDRSEASTAFSAVKNGWSGRISDPTVLDYFVHRASALAAERAVPIQFHTGFGDSDAHPRRVDPTHLSDFIVQHPSTKVVLLHAGYPYVRESGYVASTFDNVYLDLSLAIPFVQHGCERVIESAFELVPTTKVLYGSDACSVPERYVLAERRTRDALATVLENLVADGFVNEAYAATVARNVLRGNAERLYDL